MKKRIVGLLLCIAMAVSLLPIAAFAAATNIDVSKVNYYDGSGDVESMTFKFGWNTASATSRLTVMTERLRSAGEAGTNKTYGDFTDLGYYGRSFKSWNSVLANSADFGMLYYSGEQKIKMYETNIFTIDFDEGEIPLDVNATYYLYLWTCYGGYYYPDNLFAVLRVNNGKFQYAPAISTNMYGDFTTLQEAPTTPSTPTTPPAKTIDFIYVSDSDYFAEPVAWAVAGGITNGTSSVPGKETFSPPVRPAPAPIS